MSDEVSGVVTVVLYTIFVIVPMVFALIAKYH